MDSLPNNNVPYNLTREYISSAAPALHFAGPTAMRMPSQITSPAEEIMPSHLTHRDDLVNSLSMQHLSKNLEKIRGMLTSARRKE